MKQPAAKRFFTALLLSAALLLLLLFFRRVSPVPPSPDSPAAEPLHLAMPHTLADQIAGTEQLSALEKRLGQPIELHSYQSENEHAELFSLCSKPEAAGILFFQDPLSIIPLSQQGLLTDLTDLFNTFPISNTGEQFTARYQGIQYGIVLPQNTDCYFPPLLALRTDILQQYGYSGFPKTAEECLYLFDQIRANGLIPFAAYGMPTSSGFAPLLSLFSLNCEGNGEFYPEDSRIAYDKISRDAAAYLSFLRDLYARDYLPSNFLSVDSLSAINLFIRGKTPLLVVSSPKEASLLFTLCEKHEIPLDFEAIPSRSGYPHIPAIRRRNIVAVSHYAKDMSAIQNFCNLLLSDPAVQELFCLQLTPLEQELVQRFGMVSSETTLDPVSLQPSHLRLMKIFDQLNAEIIRPYYAKITTGDLSPAAFQEMCGKWSCSGGANLLEMLTRYAL